MHVLALNNMQGRLSSVTLKYWKVAMAYLKVLFWNYLNVLNKTV
jgi:hypothetical protein